MASGRIGSASGLNVFIDWSSTENSITANLYLYNQYRISTSVNKSWSLTINGNTKQGTIFLGDKSAGTTTLIGSHTVNGLSSSSNYSISGSLAINLTNYNGSAVNTLSANGTGTTDVNTPQYANLTSLAVKSRTVNSITLSYTTDRPAWLFAKINNGDWLNGGQAFKSNTTSGEFTIYYKDRASTQKLDPNTTYNITVLCRALNHNSGIDTQRDIQATTYDIAKISSLANFEHGNNPTVGISNPGSLSSLSLVMSASNAQILSRTVKAGSNTITFSDTELDNLYKKYGSSNSLTATFVLSGSGYTNSKTCTVTLKGNQKTMRTNVSSSWKRGKLWTNVNGTWKRGVLWTNVNGTWKRGI